MVPQHVVVPAAHADARRCAHGRRRASCAPSTTSSARGTSTPPDDATLLFCDNESNAARLWGAADSPPFPKDGIADHVLHGAATVNPDGTGTKVAAHVRLVVRPAGSTETWLRLVAGDAAGRRRSPTPPTIVAARRAEADEFYAAITPDAGRAPTRRR